MALEIWHEARTPHSAAAFFGKKQVVNLTNHLVYPSRKGMFILPARNRWGQASVSFRRGSEP